ncbi:hypothetical protein GCM10010486_58760 [Nonomuraea roseoviolacea subsp. carminata]
MSEEPAAGGGTGPAVEISGLRYAFGARTAVDGIDLRVAAGQVFGLLGPNGAGKTTTIRLIVTLLPCPPGSVRVFGLDAARERMAVRRRIGYVPQQLSADGALTGRQNVALFARLYGVLDPVARAVVWERIGALRAETGMTVLVTTHYMDEAEQHCDRVALMSLGRIRALGVPAELTAGLGPEASLEDVFRVCAGDSLSFLDAAGGDARDIRSTRRTASRLG